MLRLQLAHQSAERLGRAVKLADVVGVYFPGEFEAVYIGRDVGAEEQLGFILPLIATYVRGLWFVQPELDKNFLFLCWRKHASLQVYEGTDDAAAVGELSVNSFKFNLERCEICHQEPDANIWQLTAVIRDTVAFPTNANLNAVDKFLLLIEPAHHEWHGEAENL